MNNNIASLWGTDLIPLDQIPEQEDRDGQFEPLPVGWYAVTIEKSEVMETKSGNGKYLKLDMVVIGDPCAGRHIFTNITLINPNEQAEQIGMRELGAVGKACGLQTLSGSDELLNKQLDVRVKIKKREGYPPDNDVTAYKPLGQGTATQKPAAPPAAAGTPPVFTPPGASGVAPPAGGAKKMPWE